MAALAKDRDTLAKGTTTVSLPVAASTKIYAGSIVVVNAAGYAVPGSVSTTLKVAGRADFAADNSSGAAGAISVQVSRGIFCWENATAGDAVVQANLLGKCWIMDDNTVAGIDGSATRSVAGTVVAIDAMGVWVQTPAI